MIMPHVVLVLGIFRRMLCSAITRGALVPFYPMVRLSSSCQATRAEDPDDFDDGP
jgi:hypothetical protein